MNYAHAIDRLRTRTTPSTAMIARARNRVVATLQPAAELAALPGVDPAAVARVRARLAATTAPGRSWSGWLVAIPLVAAAAYVASTAMPPQPPRLLTLTGTGEALSLAGVTLGHEGRGNVTVSGSHTTIDWEIGRLSVAVDQGHGLTVSTAEGKVVAQGPTSLIVVRDALGTEITPGDAPAVATCLGNPSAELTSPTLCLPTTPAGLMNRARTLASQGAVPGAVAQTAELGLRTATGAVRAELFVLRANAATQLGDFTSALADTEAALDTASSDGRTEALHRSAARLAILLDDCGAAVPHLDALPELTEEEAQHRAACDGSR